MTDEIQALLKSSSYSGESDLRAVLDRCVSARRSGRTSYFSTTALLLGFVGVQLAFFLAVVFAVAKYLGEGRLPSVVAFFAWQGVFWTLLWLLASNARLSKVAASLNGERRALREHLKLLDVTIGHVRTRLREPGVSR